MMPSQIPGQPRAKLRALTPTDRRVLVLVATRELHSEVVRASLVPGSDERLDARLFALESAGFVQAVAPVPGLAPMDLTSHGKNALCWNKRARVATIRAMLCRAPTPGDPERDGFAHEVTRAARLLDRAWKEMGVCRPWGPDGHEVHRVDQHCPCPDCGWPYRLHPHDWAELTELGRTRPEPYLRIACDGRRLKI